MKVKILIENVLREQVELSDLFKKIQKKFGKPRGVWDSGYEDRYLNTDTDGLLIFSYTTGLRGDDLDNYEGDYREDALEKLQKFLKPLGYTADWADGWGGWFVVYSSKENWKQTYKPPYWERQ